MEKTRIDALKQEYCGPMSQREVALLRDMQAFIEFCIQNGLNYILVLSTLAHDVNGLLRQEPGLVPKVTGYSEIIGDFGRQMADMAADPEIQSELRG